MRVMDSGERCCPECPQSFVTSRHPLVSTVVCLMLKLLCRPFAIRLPLPAASVAFTAPMATTAPMASTALAAFARLETTADSSTGQKPGRTTPSGSSATLSAQGDGGGGPRTRHRRANTLPASGVRPAWLGGMRRCCVALLAQVLCLGAGMAVTGAAWAADVGAPMRPATAPAIAPEAGGATRAIVEGGRGAGASADPDAVVLVTPFVEGSGPDHVARVLAQAWSARAGVPVTVRNLPENQGRTAARWIADAATDGRLVLLTSARMLDAQPPAPRADRQRPGTAGSARASQWEATPPVSLARFRLLAQVGGLPFMSVFPADLTPSPMQSRADQRLGGSRPPPDPRILAALARMGDLSADATDRVTTRALPPLISHPDSFPRGNWNGLLVSARMPAARAEALQHLLSGLLALPEVRWAVAEAGSDLWEEIPPPMPVETMPLRR